ncbi:MAG: hypothetical protein CL847_01485 [Crocinitomicaceae bacterium]|nr:hypothetical protein [Crocinitomicaceae bacterium]|tara:strand:- start:16104 stop:16592 length:489 start_codon:yes stop_codon:yes gene_type:complete
MKKLSMVLAVVAMMVSPAIQAQLTKKPDNTRGSRNVVVEEDEKVKIFGTVLSYTQSGRAVVKIDFDEIVHRISPDKSAAKLCLDLQNYRYSSLGEALNVLSTHGWTPDMAWTSEDNRNGTITHMVISKEIDKLMPVFPWKEKQGEKDGEDAKYSGKSARKIR